MPSSSTKQRNYIFYLRGKYKDKSSTPEKDKWIWDSEWETVKEMERYIPFNFEEEDLDERSITVDSYKSPEGGPDISDKDLNTLGHTYASCRKDSQDKTKCSKIAWSQVNKSKNK
jgi:hypothetical protein